MTEVARLLWMRAWWRHFPSGMPLSSLYRLYCLLELREARTETNAWYNPSGTDWLVETGFSNLLLKAYYTHTIRLLWSLLTRNILSPPHFTFSSKEGWVSVGGHKSQRWLEGFLLLLESSWFNTTIHHRIRWKSDLHPLSTFKIFINLITARWEYGIHDIWQ